MHGKDSLPLSFSAEFLPKLGEQADDKQARLDRGNGFSAADRRVKGGQQHLLTGSNFGQSLAGVVKASFGQAPFGQPLVKLGQSLFGQGDAWSNTLGRKHRQSPLTTDGQSGQS